MPSLKKKLLLVLLFVVLLPTLPFPQGKTPPKKPFKKTPIFKNPPGIRYNFSYRFQMDMKGKVMLMVGYRFFYEAGASVNFISHMTEGGKYQFCYDGIGDTGYVISTGGLKGGSLWFFTADYNLEKASRFREYKVREFKLTEPYYSENLEKIRAKPMQILSASSTEEAIRFDRDTRGVHSNPVIHLRLTDPHSNTFSNIYEIMGELLGTYNHSYLPGGGFRTILEENQQRWHSPYLDFSDILTRAAKLTSERAQEETHFKQMRKFRLNYQIIEHTNQYLDICGEGYPNTRVWKDMKLRELVRRIRVRLPDEQVIYDEIFLDFRNDDGKGGSVFLNLRMID